MKLTIIDGDSIGYTIGWTKKELSPDDIMPVIVSVDTYMEQIITATQATHILGFLGGVQPTFRDLSVGVGEVFDVKIRPYKEGRGIVKPDWYYKTFYLINHRLRTKYGFTNIEFVEADDAVTMAAEYYTKHYSGGTDVTLAHCDKDLKQFPGTHYDYKKNESFLITPEEASFNFWKQMIMGDSTDTVEGIPGMGEVKASKFLEGTKPESYKENVLTLYQSQFGERAGLLRFAMTYNYLYMLREPHYNFRPEDFALTATNGLLNPEGASLNNVDISEMFNSENNGI